MALLIDVPRLIRIGLNSHARGQLQVCEEVFGPSPESAACRKYRGG